MVMKVESPAFQDGGFIPEMYTCDGEDVSPPLNWGPSPEGIVTWALVCDDPDAPMGTWVHWVVYDLPADVLGLSEDVLPEKELENGGKQGVNDFQKIGYGGPCPPIGEHRYFFKVYALDVGLLGAMANSPVELLVQGERLFNEYEGAFVENYVAQQLISHFSQPLYYWRSKGGKAEVDFLYELIDLIFPLEVKAGINPKSKSLKSYDDQFKPDHLMRTNLLNLKKDGKICNLPLYAISQLTTLLATI